MQNKHRQLGKFKIFKREILALFFFVFEKGSAELDGVTFSSGSNNRNAL